MYLTPDICERIYELLRVTKPYSGWRLPDADEVEFRVSKSKTSYGGCGERATGHLIELSAFLNADLTAAMQTMAHEMIHLRQHIIGVRYERDGNHGRTFDKAASKVCRENRWYRKF